jgi:hypothetical protein
MLMTRAEQAFHKKVWLPGRLSIIQLSEAKLGRNPTVIPRQRTMLITMTLSRLSTVKSGCHEPGVPLQVRASKQMLPPAVTCPVSITHLHKTRSNTKRFAGSGTSANLQADAATSCHMPSVHHTPACAQPAAQKEEQGGACMYCPLDAATTASLGSRQASNTVAGAIQPHTPSLDASCSICMCKCKLCAAATCCITVVSCVPN